MNSPFGNLFLSLQALIAGLQDNSNKKYFPLVDQDLGQLETVDAMGRYPVSWPCVLIDIDEMHFSSVGENAQEGKGNICLRLGFQPFSSSSNITPDAYRQKALYYYDLEQVLHQALQGTVPSLMVDAQDVLVNVFGHYNRIGIRTERRTDNVRVRVMTYALAMDDYTTQDQITLTPAAINLTDQISL